MILTKFPTSPRIVQLSDASVTISSVRLHMLNLQTKLSTALFWVEDRSSQLLWGESLKSGLKPSFINISQLVQIKQQTWTHTHTVDIVIY